MIKHGNLKDDLMSALNLIDELKGVSIQARFLASKILRCHPDWKISWTYFAKICGVNLSTICRWKDELEKAKIWHCEDIIKDGKKEILITFLIKNKSLAKMQTLANLQLAKMQTLANLQTIKERKICNFSQKRDEFFSNEKNYFKKTSKKNFCENENFAENQSEISNSDLNATKNTNDLSTLNETFKNNVGDFKTKNADFESENGRKTSEISHQKHAKKSEGKNITKTAQKAKKSSLQEILSGFDFSDFSEIESEKLYEFFEAKKEVERHLPSVRAVKQLLNRAKDFKKRGINLCECLDNAICSSWRNFYEPKANYKTAAKTAKKPFIPTFFNCFDEENFIIREIMKINPQFTIFSDEFLNKKADKYEILGSKIAYIGGHLAFVREGV